MARNLPQIHPARRMRWTPNSEKPGTPGGLDDAYGYKTKVNDMNDSKPLLRGQFLNLYNLALETTESDIQATIKDRTGVEISLERISVQKNAYRCRALVSIGPNEICDLLNWAFSEDKMYGRPVIFETGRRVQTEGDVVYARGQR